MVKKISANQVRIKRAYAKPTKEDGARILIDRLWPRGIKKEDLHLSEWEKELSPSTELRQWFDHDPARWDEFQKRYKAELAEHRQTLDALRERAKDEVICLVYGAKDEEHNNALVVREVLLDASQLPGYS